MSETFKDGLYLALIRATIPPVYDCLPSTLWNRFIKRREKAPFTPRWAPEVFQLAFLALGLGVLAMPLGSIPGSLSVALRIVVGIRLVDIFVFCLHWVFIARDPVLSHRRSLASFGVNVFEVPVLYTVMSLLAGCSPPSQVSWSVLYANLGDLLSLSLPTTQGGTLRCAIGAHGALVLEGVLLLLVLTVVVGMISREERDSASSEG